ncbi:MAG: lytic transglycosylase domain-containing protein [Rhodospirillaceae bacterium]|nr:lytic transglycosylase domain-containing protein [Rhodospirillaceae bacterium]
MSSWLRFSSAALVAMGIAAAPVQAPYAQTNQPQAKPSQTAKKPQAKKAAAQKPAAANAAPAPKPLPATVLPERKPPVPTSAETTVPAPSTTTASDAAPSKSAGTRFVLPERKPPLPGGSAVTSAAAIGKPSVATRLGLRTEPAHLSAQDREALTEALRAASLSRWSRAFEHAEKTKNPVIRDIIKWAAMRTPGGMVDFGARTAFIEQHPDWPAINELARITETIAQDSGSPAQRIAWFSKRAPVTTKGKVAYADAVLAAGDLPAAEKLARDAWINGRFDAGEEREFLEQFGRFITPKDHEARLEELLYAEQRPMAERMLNRVSPEKAEIARARIALIGAAGNIEKLIEKLSAQAKEDPGLIYDRIKWRRTRDRDDEARALLPNKPDTAPRPDLWWKERAILARDSLQNGNAKEAYQIAINHGAIDPVSVSEAEWLAGWIALRFLNDANAALIHFQKVYDTVQLAANLSRGAYWVGRAAEALGRADIAADWYSKAAVHVTTFYGQLALGRLKGGMTLPQLPQDPIASVPERTSFESKNLTKAVRALADVPGGPYLRPFLLALAESSDFAVDRNMAAELATKLGRADLGVWIARQAGRDRIIIMTHGYPIPTFAFPEFPEKALQLAIMRQESNFDPSATSPAGALGLMQLMPATAKAMAKTAKANFNKSKLTADPSYNVRLGAQYLHSLVETFDGSYIMAAAGYNAGPGRARQWAQRFGDPRDPTVDAVDWIESIPFSETRNYVQRVMENVIVYRSLLGDTLNVPQTLDRDLKRGRASILAVPLDTLPDNTLHTDAPTADTAPAPSPIE